MRPGTCVDVEWSDAQIGAAIRMSDKLKIRARRGS